MATLPEDTLYGVFTGRFLKTVADTSDAGQEPDVVPMTGSVTFTPTITTIVRDDIDPPATYFNYPIQAVLDPEGFVATRDEVGNLTRGVTLIATDTPLPSRYGTWGYRITISLDGVAGIQLESLLPAGEVVDLSAIIPPNGGPSFISQDTLLANIILDKATDTNSAIRVVASEFLDGVGEGGLVTSVNGRQGVVTGLAEQITVDALNTAIANRAPINSPTFTGNVTVPTPTTQSNPVTKKYIDDIIASLGNTQTPDATTTSSGKIRLAGDLAGTASAPSVPGLANKQDKLVTGTSTEYFRGDLQRATLNKAAVGLDQVDNTPDASKPISTAQATRMNAIDGGSGPVQTAETWTGAVNLLASSLGATRTVTLSGNVTLSITSGAATRAGTITLFVVQGSGGSKLITWPTGMRWHQGTKPTLSTAAGAVDVITLFWNGNYWTGLLGAAAIA